jgi:hypothetical protein
VVEDGGMKKLEVANWACDTGLGRLLRVSCAEDNGRNTHRSTMRLWSG